MGVKMGWWHVQLFTCRMTKNDEKGIISFMLSSLLPPDFKHKVEVAMVTCLMAMNCEVKPGGPPRSPAERKNQEHIDALRAQLGHKK